MESASERFGERAAGAAYVPPPEPEIPGEWKGSPEWLEWWDEFRRTHPPEAAAEGQGEPVPPPLPHGWLKRLVRPSPPPTEPPKK